MCSSLATGPRPDCPRPSKAPCVRDKGRRKLLLRRWKMNDVSRKTHDTAALDDAVARATKALLAMQGADGHFVFELEADATIPAEYVLLVHYLGEPADAALEAKIAAYLHRIQGQHGGWPLFHDGPFNIRSSVIVYFAIKLIGDDIEAVHMNR